MAGWQIALCFLAAALSGSHAVTRYSEAGKYFVTAPKKAELGTVYTVTVQLFDVQSPVNFSAYIERDNGYSNNIQQWLFVTPVVSHSVVSGSLETFALTVPVSAYSSTYHTYRLHVRGTGGLQIEETYSVSMEVAIASVYVQTDRQVYAPGETVTFKTFALYNSDLSSYTDVYDVTLTAGNKKMITWTTTSGADVNTFSYDLDTHTIMGRWTITTNSLMTGSHSSTFNVQPKNSKTSVVLASPQIRLVGGASASEGRVEVEVNGEWGTVCDDDFGVQEARVVCRQLGYSDTSQHVYSSAHFGQGTGRILLDGLGCSGSEGSLLECRHNGIGVHDCSHSEDVGVGCSGGGSVGGSSGSGMGSPAVENAIDVKVYLPKTMNTSVDLVGSFEASYPLGVAVKGTAEIEMRGYGKTLQFNGNASFTFPYHSLTSGETTVTVRVTEDETDVIGTGQSSVALYTRDVKIEFTEQTPAVFKPKLPFTAYVKISNHADEPLHIPADSVFSTVYVYGVGHYRRDSPSQHFGVSSFTGSYPILARKLTLPDSGLFSIDMDIPEDVTSIDLIVTFQSIQEKLSLRQAQRNEGDNYLQIYLLDDVPAVTDVQSADVKFRVLSSNPIDELTIELVSRGQVVSAQQPALTAKTTSGDAFSAEFTVTLTWDMTPVTEVIAYHIVENNHLIQEVMTDSMSLNVKGLFENTIEVTSDEKRVEPGQEVVVHVRARPGSSVGILVEEDNALSGETFTLEYVSQRIEKTSRKPLSSHDALATTQQYGQSTFSAANVLTMDGRGYGNSGTRTSPVQQTAYRGRSVDSSRAPNTVFMETNTTGPDGRATFTVTLPDSVTTWAVVGFAFDPAGHVGVVDQPLLIEAVHEVYGTLLGPDHVVSGEQVILTAYVHNTRDIESRVTVVLNPKENVEILNITQDGSLSTSTDDQQQIVTVPARNSKQVFFTVTSPPGLPTHATNAYLKLVVKSGDSKQIIPYFYTVVPQGVEQTFTVSDLTDVSGQVTKDLSVSAPKEALPGTTTRSVAVTDDFSDLLVPLALAEEDVMEEGTGPAALLHLALPVMLARYRPEMVPQLKGPMERGYQRLMSFMSSNRFSMFLGKSVYSDWLGIASLPIIAEAKDFVYVDSNLVTTLLFHYYSYYHSSYTTTDLLRNAGNWYPLPTQQDLVIFSTLSVKDISQHVDVHGHVYNGAEEYDSIVSKAHAVLQGNYSQVDDPLTLSYVALANLRYGNGAIANHALGRLMALQDPAAANTDEIFWNTNVNDTLNYYGDWPSGHHVFESRDIVTAANALQVLVYTGQNAAADRVARWLVRQRNGNGLFKTAWDTLAATEALLDYGSRHKASSGQLQLDTGLTTRQRAQWLSQGQVSSFNATGQGMVFSQVEVKHHVTDEVGDESFEVVPVVLDESLDHFKLMVCSRWLRRDKTSGLTVQEVTLPSGFVADLSGIGSQTQVMTYIRRNDTAFTVIMNQVERDSTCYTVSVNRIHPVAHTSPAYIVTRGYYNPENHDIVAYHPRRLMESTACDLCSSCCSSP